MTASEKSKEQRKEQKKPAQWLAQWHDNIFIATGLFLLVILLLYIVLGESLGVGSLGKPLGLPGQNLTAPRNLSGLEEFTATLSAAESLAIVQDVTGTTANQSQIVFSCGAGLAGSWGRLGRNISNLHIYIIDGESCLYSTPVMVNVTGQLYTEKSTSECMGTYSALPRFHVSYGPSFSMFTNTTATIYVDENFKGECKFSIPGAKVQEKPQIRQYMPKIEIRTVNETNETE